MTTTKGASSSRTDLMTRFLQEKLVRILGASGEQIDPEQPLLSLGMDSLMGLEFVRRLSSALQIAVPATVVFNYPNIRVLARHLLQRMQLQPADDTAAASRKTPSVALPNDVSEEDALQALMGGKGNA